MSNNETFEPLNPELTAKLLTPPTGPVRAVLDTDTYNEIDDQYALAYAILAPDIDLEAVYAAPFFNSRSSGPQEGMEKSYEEIGRVLKRVGPLATSIPGTVLKGSSAYMSAADKPVDSPAARDLVERAMSGGDDPLYVLTIGAATNVASALLMEPRIRERIVIVWLGGHPRHWPSAVEFNLKQDPHGSRLLFDSGAPLVQIPCKQVAEQLKTTVPELEHYLRGKNSLCDYLCDITKDYMVERGSMSKVVWDISAIGWVRNSSWVPTVLIPSPVLTTDLTWSINDSRHLVRIATDVNRDKVFSDVFSLLTGAGG